MKVGLDVGSTTIKCVVLDDRNNLIYHTYERHYSHIVEKSAELLRRVVERCGREAVFAISGSAGMGLADSCGVPFVQEVFSIIGTMHELGITILLVEQNAKMALAIADRAYVLENGRITMSGGARDLLHDDKVRKAYLGA